MYGVVVQGWYYLRLDGATQPYPIYPFETPEAARKRAESAVLKNISWYVVDEHDYPEREFPA